MRLALVGLAPEWIRGPDRGARLGGRIGFSFLCPEHSDHRLSVYFIFPPDGDDPITAGNDDSVVGHCGSRFTDMSLDRGLRHGRLLVFVQDGDVITG